MTPGQYLDHSYRTQLVLLFRLSSELLPTLRLALRHTAHERHPHGCLPAFLNVSLAPHPRFSDPIVSLTTLYDAHCTFVTYACTQVVCS